MPSAARMKNMGRSVEALFTALVLRKKPALYRLSSNIPSLSGFAMADLRACVVGFVCYNVYISGRAPCGMRLSAGRNFKYTIDYVVVMI